MSALPSPSSILRLELHADKSNRPETHLLGTGRFLISGVEHGEKAVTLGNEAERRADIVRPEAFTSLG